MSKEFAGPHEATKVTPKVWAHENGIIKAAGTVGIYVGSSTGKELKKWVTLVFTINNIYIYI